VRKTTYWLLAAAGLVALVAVWYYFRPERAFIDRPVNDALPAGEAAVLLSGEFSPRAHDGRGLAQVLQLADGRRLLRLTRFATLNGPDLQVYLLGRSDVAGRADLEQVGYAPLGALKGNVGDQNYAIPADLDLARYAAVAVWCRRFGVNFTTAPLAAVVRP